MVSMEELVRRFVKELKQYYSEEWGYEWNVDEEAGIITIKHSNQDDYAEIHIDFEMYGAQPVTTITIAEKVDEIVTPESCHECEKEDCIFFDMEKGKCKITDSMVEKEIREWEDTLVETRNLTVEKVVVQEECPIKNPHYHYYKGYRITYVGFISADMIRALDMLFDTILDISYKAYQSRKTTQGK